jgi:spore coat protein U domain-containing protein, fimbrial subunit CupE1/2/3/6
MFTKKMSARMLTVAGATALALGAVSGTQAASPQTADLSVTATVSANCTIATTAVAFGEYDPVTANSATALTATGKVSVTCTTGAPATITLGQGPDPGASSTDAAPVRRMKSGSDYLNYNLYSDNAYSNVWGNDATSDVDNTGTGANQDITVYGRVPAGQNVPTGNYSDTVVATITF